MGRGDEGWVIVKECTKTRKIMALAVGVGVIEFLGLFSQASLSILFVLDYKAS